MKITMLILVAFFTVACASPSRGINSQEEGHASNEPQGLSPRDHANFYTAGMRY
ncbi:MAG: hypothetical protein ACLGG0_05055 [Bacteriovoracia bacterium]